MVQLETMTLKRFQEKFDSENACHKHLFKIRWPNGFCCPKCQNQSYCYLETRKLYQCTACKHQSSVTAGTIMHKSHTMLLTWFWAIFLVAHDKRAEFPLSSFLANSNSLILQLGYYFTKSGKPWGIATLTTNWPD